MTKKTEMIMIDEYLPLRDAVLKALRGEIMTGKLKPGERLLEIDLSRRMGVSRTPIREALHKLELEGLVITSPRRGARVTNINAKDFMDVMEVRLAVETLAISLACERIEEEQKEKLCALMEAIEDGGSRGDTGATTDADVEFHNTIVEAAHNKRLTNIINNLQEQMYRYRFEYIKNPDSYDDIVREHRNMYRAIIDGDKERAVESLRAHIESQERGIMKKIEQEAREDD